MFSPQHAQLNTLHDLNEALKSLTPSISGIDLSMFATPGANIPMLDFVIAHSNASIYNGMKRSEIVDALKPQLTTRIDTQPIPLIYDVHGDKHFAGGPAGTKFSGAKTVVNPFIEELVAPLAGRIRRDAAGRTAPYTYYLTARPNQYTGKQSLVVQIDYTPSPESLTYHGYPADVTAYVLSRTLAGAAIP